MTMDFQSCSITVLDRDLNDLNIQDESSFTVSVMLLTWSLNSAEADMVTPRSFVDGLVAIGSFVLDVYVVDCWIWVLWPYLRSSNLLSLNSMLFAVAHLYTCSRSCCNRITSSGVAISLPIRVSSAKLEMNVWAISLSMSPIRMRKSRGPITEPCGTPEITGVGSDFSPLTRTVWCLPVRNEWSHLPIFPSTPRCLSFCRVMLKSSLSNAFAKSK